MRKNFAGGTLASAALVTAAVFLLFAGIGALTSYLDPSRANGSVSTTSSANGEMLQRLAEYAHSVEGEEPASMAAPGQPLPDVDTMIERLAARLKTAPKDVEGWRMLGWSYFNTARYEQAATAYARALELDPNSAELKGAYDEAKAKASQSARSVQPTNGQ